MPLFKEPKPLSKLESLCLAKENLVINNKWMILTYSEVKLKKKQSLPNNRG